METDCRKAALHLLATIGLALTGAGCPERPTDPDDGGRERAASGAATSASASATTADAAPLASSTATTSASSAPSAVTSSSAAPSADASTSASAKPSSAPIKVGQPPPRLPKGWVEGRPFIVREEPRLASIVEASTWSAKRLDVRFDGVSRETRDALIEHFTFWALAEHASVASFSRFTLQLLALGAPSDLVAASVRAVADEIRHAELGFRFLAALGHDVAPGPLAITNALSEGETLESVFRLVVRESILGETVAAVEAAQVVTSIACAVFREELRALAEDEARHAELGFMFAAWAIRKDRSLCGVLAEELANFTLPSPRACAGVEAWGVLSTEDRRRIHQSAHELLVIPLCERLLQMGTAPTAPRELLSVGRTPLSPA